MTHINNVKDEYSLTKYNSNINKKLIHKRLSQNNL
jgi:hypothetical protein